MKETSTKYVCDKCGKEITYAASNGLDIVTSLSESASWSRLHVNIAHRHGFHNDADIDKAELCKPCTVKLLKGIIYLTSTRNERS